MSAEEQKDSWRRGTIDEEAEVVAQEFPTSVVEVLPNRGGVPEIVIQAPLENKQ